MKIIKNKKEFYTLAKKNNLQLSTWAKELIEKASFDDTSKVEYIVKSVAELGFPDGATYGNIITTAEKNGYSLLSHAQALSYALNYKLTAWHILAIDSITDSGGYRPLFRVGHDDDDLWLDGDYGDVDYFWHGRSVFVFGLRKSSALKTQPSSDALPFELNDKVAIAHLKQNGYKITREETKIIEY